MTWDVSQGAVNYIVRAMEAGGHNSSCTATSSHCQVSDLKCATNYTLRVYAVNNYCESSESNSTTLQIETGIQQKAMLFFFLSKLQALSHINALSQWFSILGYALCL